MNENYLRTDCMSLCRVHLPRAAAGLITTTGGGCPACAKPGEGGGAP